MARRKPSPPRTAQINKMREAYVSTDDKTMASQINSAFEEYGKVERTAGYYQDLSGLTS